MIENVPTAPRPARAEVHPRRRRILARRDFTETYAEGRRLVGRLLVVFVIARGGEGRLGVTATRKAGGAVLRNRARRRIREVYRRWRGARASSAAFDVVVNVPARAARAPFAALASDLVALLERAGSAGPGRP